MLSILAILEVLSYRDSVENRAVFRKELMEARLRFSDVFISQSQGKKLGIQRCHAKDLEFCLCSKERCLFQDYALSNINKYVHS